MGAAEKKILLVDDERGVRDILRVNLAAEGYRILEAGDGMEALQIVRDSTPDLIILDVMMPKMDGWEVLRRLEENPETAGLPVIMLSVRAEDLSVMQGLEQGALEYLTKPFDPLEVVSVVRLLLEELDTRGRHAYRLHLMERRRRSARSLGHLFDLNSPNGGSEQTQIH